MVPSGSHRPRCFFDINMGSVPAGRIIFELFSDICPITCENFRALCTGDKGMGKTTNKPLHYKGSSFHRIVKDFMIQGGDFSSGTGTGGESIYGGTFPDENFDMKHDQPFLLSMANRGKDTNGSQFFITTKPAPHLDGVHVVFGRVLQGDDIVAQMENQRTDSKSRPLTDVRIANCGELVLKLKTKESKRKKKAVSSDSDSESSDDSNSSSSSTTTDTESSSETDSEEERRKRKKYRRKLKLAKRRKKERQKKKQQSKKKKEQEPAWQPKEFKSEVTHVTINPDEIPDVPTNRFLMRDAPNKNNTEDEGRQQQQQQRYSPRSAAGRKIKGRGQVRYNKGHLSHSPTPPHWKAEIMNRNKVIDEQRAKWEQRPDSLERWERGSALKEKERKHSRDRDEDRDRSHSRSKKRRTRERDDDYEREEGELDSRDSRESRERSHRHRKHRLVK